MSSAVFFVYGLLAFFATVNALRGPAKPNSRVPPLWLPAVLTAEAPIWWAGVRVALAILAVMTGLRHTPLGRAGLALVLVSLILQPVLIWRGERSARQLSSRRASAAWWEKAFSWPYHLPPGVERLENLPYAHSLTLDLYRPRSRPGPLPCLVYLHGGSWGGGDPRRQFRPIIHHLARNGWVIATIRYPLSPQATFPDHLTGAVLVLDWLEENALAFDVDSQRLAIAGGSAGAHLASLLALGGDKRIRAAVGLYGVYDLFNRHGHRADWPVIPTRVMKTTAALDPDLYRQASPVDLAHPEAPPFLLVHGDYDSLVPIAETKFFASRLAEAGAEVEMLEVRWAQHAFDVLNGVRSRALAIVVEEFLLRHVSMP